LHKHVLRDLQGDFFQIEIADGLRLIQAAQRRQPGFVGDFIGRAHLGGDINLRQLRADGGARIEELFPGQRHIAQRAIQRGLQLRRGNVGIVQGGGQTIQHRKHIALLGANIDCRERCP